jgi:hypothetical protein
MRLKNDSEPIHVILHTSFCPHNSPVVGIQSQRTTSRLLVDHAGYVSLLVHVHWETTGQLLCLSDLLVVCGLRHGVVLDSKRDNTTTLRLVIRPRSHSEVEEYACIVLAMFSRIV